MIYHQEKPVYNVTWPYDPKRDVNFRPEDEIPIQSNHIFAYIIGGACEGMTLNEARWRINQQMNFPAPNPKIDEAMRTLRQERRLTREALERHATI